MAKAPRILQAWIWLTQLLVLLAIGATLLMMPEQILVAQTLDGTAASERSITALAGGDRTVATFDHQERIANRVVEDAARTHGPLLIGLALFTLFALMQGQSRQRKQMARVFAVGFFTWLLGITWSAWSIVFSGVSVATFVGTVSVGGWIILAMVGVLFVSNLIIGWSGEGAPAVEEKMRGSANTHPSELWTLFVIQGLVFFFLGTSLAIWPDFTLGLFAQTAGTAADALGSVRGKYIAIGSAWVLMALFSWFAATLEEERSWRSMSRLFVAWMVLWLGAVAWNYDRHAYRGWVLLIATGMVALLVIGHIIALGGLRAVWALIGHAPPIVSHENATIRDVKNGWLWRDLLLGPAMLMQTRKTTGRATHRVGVGGRGTLTVDLDTDVPRHAFFERAERWPVNFRGANLTRADDRESDIRGFSISLRDDDDKPVLDLLMNSGPISAVAHLLTFMAFALTKASQRMSTYLLSTDIVAREASIAGTRLGPESVLDVHYYSQVVRYWIATDGVRWRVRYRLVPLDDEGGHLPFQVQSGLLDEERASRVWFRDRAEGDTKSPHHLVDELRERVGPETKPRLVLEGQFDRAERGDSSHWYNSTVDWPERCHPWLRIGVVELEQVTAPEVTERLQFNGGNHPSTLPVPDAPNVIDPRSLGDSERRVIARLQRVRAYLKFPPFREDS